MSTITIQRKPTQKQRERMAALNDDIKVVDWDNQLRGPVLRFPTGTLMVITRDGGLSKL